MIDAAAAVVKAHFFRALDVALVQCVLMAYRSKAHMGSATKVADYLPLSPQAFEVLLALSAGEQHGYRIMRDIARASGGAMTLHAGTLYRTLARLLEQGLIEELDERPAARCGR